MAKNDKSRVLHEFSRTCGWCLSWNIFCTFARTYFLAYIITAFINTLIDYDAIKLMLELKLKNTFRWLFLANTISVMLCAIYIHFVPIRL